MRCRSPSGGVASRVGGTTMLLCLLLLCLLLSVSSGVPGLTEAAATGRAEAGDESTTGVTRPVLVEVFPANGGTIHDLISDEARDLLDGHRAIGIVWHAEADDPLLFPAASQRAEDLDAAAGEVRIEGMAVSQPVTVASIPAVNRSAAFSITASATRYGPTDRGIEVKANIVTERNVSMAAVIQWIVLEDLVPTADHPRAARDDAVAVAYRFETSLNRTVGGMTESELGLTEEDLAEWGVEAVNAGPLSVVVLIRDITTDEVLGAALVSVPEPSPATDTSARLGVVVLLVLALGTAVWMVVGERFREAAMPRFSARSERRLAGGMRYQIVARAGSRGIEVREVRADPPWRVGGRSPRFELTAGSVAEHEIRLQRTGDGGDDAPMTHWSIEVEGFGAWVIDLRFRPPDEEE